MCSCVCVCVMGDGPNERAPLLVQLGTEAPSGQEARPPPGSVLPPRSFSLPPNNTPNLRKVFFFFLFFLSLITRIHSGLSFYPLSLS